MSAPYKLYGVDLSPYSQKVRAYLRYKGLSHEWLVRSQARMGEFQEHAKLPLVPLILGADGVAMQDSTPIIETLEARHPEPSIIPEDPALAFLSALLEDYADEWLNKPMFHYRWTYEADQISGARRIVDNMLDGIDSPHRATIEAQVRERMTGRLHFVGSNAGTLETIEASYTRALDHLEPILSGQDYLFGERPCLADFGIASQLQQLLSDPTPGAYMKAHAPAVAAWCDRMAAPNKAGDFAPFEVVAEDIAPLLNEEIAALYLPWMAANAAAAAEGAASFTVQLDGKPFTQAPQKYAARAYLEIRKKRAGAVSPALDVLLEETGCEKWLAL